MQMSLLHVSVHARVNRQTIAVIGGFFVVVPRSANFFSLLKTLHQTEGRRSSGQTVAQGTQAGSPGADDAH